MEVLPDESLRERCGCQTTTQPEGDEDEDEDEDEDVENKQLVQQVAEYESENSALRNALCATALADALEWQEDADVVEITDTSLTMVVTEDVVLYTLCHTACSSSCGVEHSVSDVSIYEDELVCDGGERTPVSSFFNVTNEMFWMYEDAMVVNVLGTEDDDGTEMSVKMVVWNPVYDEATSTVRFDARLASGSEDVMDDDESHLSPSPEGDRRRRRRRLQQARRATTTYVSRNELSRKVSSARVSGVRRTGSGSTTSRLAVARDAANSVTSTRSSPAPVSRSSPTQASSTDFLRRPTAFFPRTCQQCVEQGFICELISAPDWSDRIGVQPGLIIDGNVTIQRASDGEQFRGVSGISGDVLITGSHGTNLDFFSDLVTVGGNLIIERITTLTNLDGLSNLAIVGGNLVISRSNELQNLDGLSSLRIVRGDVIIERIAKLSSLDGLRSLDSVDGTCARMPPELLESAPQNVRSACRSP